MHATYNRYIAPPWKQTQSSPASISHLCVASIVHAWLFLGAIGVVQAQNQEALVTAFGSDRYDAGTQNWSADMDKDGFIYFGNNKGLLRYDGNLWKRYELPNHTIIRSVYIAPTGNIWVGGQNEFGVFKRSPYSGIVFESYRHLVPPAYLDFEDVWKIMQVGSAIFCCSEKAVFKILGDSLRTIVPISQRFENYFELNGQLYFQDELNGLYRLDSLSLVQVVPASAYGNDRIVGLFEREELLHVLTQERGIFALREGALVPTMPRASQHSMKYSAYSFCMLHSGDLAIGTVLDGLALFSADDSLLSMVNRKKGLPNQTVLAIYEDPNHNLWLGLDNGIAQISYDSPFQFINSTDGLEGTGYTAFTFEDATYLGTNQGLFSKADTASSYQALPDASGQIWSANDINGHMYINTHAGTFHLIDNKLYPISTIPGAWKLLELNQYPGLIAQGAYDGIYLYRWREESSHKLELLHKLEGFNESARIIEEGSGGDLWVAHAYRGLFKISLSADGQQVSAVTQYGHAEGLPQEYYISVSKIRGELAFATTQGAYRYLSDSARFVPNQSINEVLGASSNVLRLMQDSNGHVWFCTSDEFGRISIEPGGLHNELEVTYFNEIQDDLVDGFEDVFALSEEVTFIPIESGFIQMDTGVSLEKNFSHPLFIEGVYAVGITDSLMRSGASGSELVLEHQLNTLKFTYASPNYQLLNTIYYQHRLLGQGEQWSNWSPLASTTYSNLSPGDYTFEVRARNSFLTTTEVQRFPFSIKPPWYASQAARLIYAFTIVAILSALYALIKSRERKKRLRVIERAKQTIARKEAEFKKETEISESEIVKLRNEKLRADIKHKNSELAATTMHLVQKSEILQKIKQDLLNAAKDSDSESQRKFKRIARTIEEDARLDKNWERFESHFDQVHHNFFKNLREKFPELTPKDQKLCAYLRMNLSTKEIAPLLNISVRGVEISRYRLRKRLHLSSDDNLVSFIMDI